MEGRKLLNAARRDYDALPRARESCAYARTTGVLVLTAIMEGNCSAVSRTTSAHGSSVSRAHTFATRGSRWQPCRPPG